jgi:hypothetical protein
MKYFLNVILWGLFKKLIVLCFLLTALAILQPAYSLDQAKNWRQITINDLQTMHDSLVENTPQYIDKLPDFMAWLDTGLVKALALAQKVNSEAGYYFTLAYYAQGFNNGHIRIEIKDLPSKYAGLLIQYQDGVYQVKALDNDYKNLPPLNAELISCDGKVSQDIIEQEIIPYRFIPRLEASSRKAARSLFLDSNPFRSLPQQCIFKVNHVNKSYKIEWHDISLTKIAEINQTLNKKYNFQISRFGPNGIWISIPNLFPKEGAERDFFEMLVKIAPEFRSFNPVVLDVRGNSGGNSSWALRLLSGLYDENYVKAIFATKKEGDLIFRVSDKNIDHTKWLAKLYPEDMREALRSLISAKIAGKQLAKVNHDKKFLSQTQNATSRFNNHLYFLTDENCFSACLNFADYVHWLPNTTHIGFSTYVDSS